MHKSALLIAVACAVPLPATTSHAGEDLYPVAYDVTYDQDACHQLWYLRNLIMDRAGYCFGSPLGRSMFDNRNCSGAEATLDADQQDQQDQVDRLAAIEQQIGCDIDTSRQKIPVEDAEFLSRLRDLPIRDGTESSCLGWKGPVTPVYDGYSRGSRVIGFIRPGDQLNLQHLPVGDWWPVLLYGADDRIRLLGWYESGEDDWSRRCTQIAG
ncbi:MAG: DUF4453 domain-containing protein [Paracoccus sp. (in: a-proteobacteria)]